MSDNFRKNSKITTKGQVTIPKKIRRFLDTDQIVFEIENGEIKIKPMRDLFGIWHEYAKPYIGIKKEREIAWEAVARNLDAQLSNSAK